MLTIPTGWPIATRPAVVLGSGRKSSFSTCWTWPLSTVISFYLHAVGKKFHIEIFDSPLSERCWHGLGMSHDHPSLLEDQPKLPLTSEDWTHGTIHIGRTAVINRAVVACVPRGVWSGAWNLCVLIVTWPFVLTVIVLLITTQRTNYNTSFRPSLVQTFEASTTI